MGLIIDTSAIIELERSRQSWEPVFEVAGAEAVFLPAIVWAELLAGVHLADSVPRALKRREKLNRLRKHVPVLPFTEEIAGVWAELFASLQRDGTPIPSNDLCVASTAVFHGHTVLVSSKDEQHYRRVPQVKLFTL